MPIVPDVKNWTWVVDTVCPECGFDAPGTPFAAIPALTRESARALAAAAVVPGAAVRPDDATWSALEYAAHARDVCRIFAYRTAVAARIEPGPPPPFSGPATVTAEGIPGFPGWDQDATAEADRYGDQDPAAVAADLSAAAGAMADLLAAIPGSALALRARRDDGSTFTVASLARYFLHDLVHHVADVRR